MVMDDSASLRKLACIRHTASHLESLHHKAKKDGVKAWMVMKPFAQDNLLDIAPRFDQC